MGRPDRRGAYGRAVVVRPLVGARVDQLRHARLVLRAHHPCVLPRLLEDSQVPPQVPDGNGIPEHQGKREAEKQKEDAAAEVAEEQIKPKRGLFGRKKVDAADAAKPADAASAAKPADK